MDSEDDGGPCKWGPLKPACCQRFRNSKVVLFWLCWAGGLQGLIVSGFYNVVVSTIERRFELSSTESGTIVSCYDIASAICLIPISYFGGLGNKPRYVAFGVLTLGIGSFLCALPHFTTGLYTFEKTEDNVCQVGGNVTDICETGTTTSSISNYKFVFIFGQLLHGAGASPFYTLGVTYMDENVPVRSSSLYNGIYFSMVVMGAAIGYLAGSQFLNLWTDVGAVDLSSISITPDNRRWVGAWWIGFVLSGTIAVLVSIPIAGFPRSLPGSKKFREERNAEMCTNDKVKATGSADAEKRRLSLSHFMSLSKGLLTNPTFVFLTLTGTSEALLVAGFSTFAPKYLESQFSLSAATAAQYIGICAVLGGGLGTLLGGLAVQKINLKVPGIIKSCLISSTVVFVCIFAFLARCPSAPFAGINVEYQARPVSNMDIEFLGKQLNDQCNSNCGCAEEDYHPVCGRDGVMYFSPCYAGCEVIQRGATIRYNNCSCIQTNHTDYMAEFTTCDTSCTLLGVFMPMFALTIALTFLITMPIMTATLRCLTEEERAYGLGMQWFSMRMLGAIPGPIVFGKMIDLSCLLWQKRCDGNGSCFFYDSRSMSYYFMGFGLVIKLCSLLFLCLALFLYKLPKGDKSVEIDITQPVTDAECQVGGVLNPVFSDEEVKSKC